MQTFTNESDGVILTVSTDKREYTVGEPVKIKSTAQNITDGELWYVCGYSVDNYPIEIHVRILCDGRYFKSDRSEIRNSNMVYFSMEPGEVYDDYVTFETDYYKGEPAEPGVYNVTCYIYTVPDERSYDQVTKHSVDFSIEVKPQAD